jgi:hypothetical protein
VSMRERARLAGGRVGIRTAIDKGTRVVVTLPIEADPACQSLRNNQEIGTSRVVRDAPAARAATPRRGLPPGEAARRIFTALGRGVLARPVVSPSRRPV